MPRLPVLATLTAALVLLSASVAAACDTQGDPDLSASLCLFGDPRARVNLYNEGTAAGTFRIVYWSGSANVRRVIRPVVGAGNVRTMKLWAHGRKDVIVRDDATGELLARITVKRSNISPSCPLPVRAA